MLSNREQNIAENGLPDLTGRQGRRVSLCGLTLVLEAVPVRFAVISETPGSTV